MFKKIIINKIVQEDTSGILNQFPNAEIFYVERDEEIFNYVKDRKEGKRVLYLSYLSGNFVKSCPGTNKNYICCQYYTINEMTNCPLDCSYCILQFYLDLPVITYFMNIEIMLQELAELSTKYPKRVIRIGTGELADSLALDKYFNVNSKIISQILDMPNIIFEVKTKTGNVDHLLPIAFERTVFSWSVNPEQIIDSEEYLTAQLKIRLDAMEKIVATPAPIGFHFDPIIFYEEWEKGYEKLINSLAEVVPAEKIAWISMGSYRHPPDLRYKVIENHSNSILTNQESILGMDGKVRYPKSLRRTMYKKIYSQLIEKFGKDIFVYFCMESPQMWNDVFGEVPKSNNHLDYLFASSIYKKFPKLNLLPPQKENYPEDW